MKPVWIIAAAWTAACCLTVAYAGGWQLDNRVSNWVEQMGGDPGLSLLRERFDGDETLLVRVDRFDPARADVREWLLALSGRTCALDAVREVADPLSLPGSPATADALALESLATRPLVQALDLVDAATPRLDFVVQLRPEASPAARAELAGEMSVLCAEGAELGLRVRAAGHPLVAAALDRESARVERVFAPLLVVLSILGVAAFLRSGLLAVLSVLPAILASAGARAALRLYDVPGDLILVSIGPIAFVVILAATLHLVSAFRLHYGAGASQMEAARSARREKLAAALLAAATTSAGFVVFLLSDLRSVAQLGLTVAITVALIVPLIFLGLTPLLGGIPLRRPRPRPETRARWRRLAEQAVRRRAWVLALAAAILIGGAYAGTELRQETDALQYFPRDHGIRHDFASIEREGGALSSAELLVRSPSTWELERESFATIGARLAAVDGLRGVFGPEVVLDEVQASAGLAAFAVPALNRQALVRAGRLDEAGEWARWTVRFPTSDDAHCRRVVAAVHAASAEILPAGGESFVTGSLPAMLEMQRHLVNTLSTSLGWTLVVTTLLFLLAVRTARELGIAVLVNLIPVAGVFLAARLLDYALDGATVMVAAVVLGLAVDNTFHILHAAGRRQDVHSRLRAIGRVAHAATISSLALALGFLTLALSGFAPTARFGILCSLGALWALASNLMVLPALWVSVRRSS